MRLLISFLFFTSVLLGQDSDFWMYQNKGQLPKQVNYQIDIKNGVFYLEQNAFTYVFHDAASIKHKHHSELENKSLSTQDFSSFHQHTVKLNFLGSNISHAVHQGGSSKHYRNYLFGTNPANWYSKVYGYSSVIYPDFYPNISLESTIAANKFKYTFTVSAGTDPSQIQYQIEGAKDVLIDKSGNLNLIHSFGKVIDSKPIAWVIGSDKTKIPVEVEYEVKKNIVSFIFPKGYDKTKTLVIDPEITFSSYTGSTVDNWGCTATPDADGNLYAGGTVFGVGYPVTTGALDVSFNGGDNLAYSGFDISLSKFNENGTAMLYSTYLGGSGSECPNSMITNTNKELLIFGITSSRNFPVTASAYDNTFNGGGTIVVDNELGFYGADIYIAKINADGTAVLNATYVGGTGNDGVNVGLSNSTTDGDLVFNYGDNYRGEIILDNAENVLVASVTRSLDFPTVSPVQSGLSGSQDAVLFKMNSNLSNLLWSTYYGGSGLETGNALAINSRNEVYITGGTNTRNMNLPNGHSSVYTGGSCEGFLSKFNAQNGALIAGTYIGTKSYDQSFFVQMDNDDDVYVLGQTDSIMPIDNGLFNNPNGQLFIRKFSPDLKTVKWNTKVGGSNQQFSPTAFLVSNCYEIYFAGWGGKLLNSSIANFPVTNDAYQKTTDGDAFYIAMLSKGATALNYATFLGGASDEHVDGGTSRFDKYGKVYHAVCSACGGLANGFVSTPGVLSPTNKSSNCNLAAFKFELNSIQSIISQPNAIVCIPNPIQFNSNSIDGDIYSWNFGDGTFSTLPNPSHVYSLPGRYTVKLKVSDSQGCKTADSTSLIVEVGSANVGAVSPITAICPNTAYQLQASGGANYEWFPPTIFDDFRSASPIVRIEDTTNIMVVVSDVCGADTIRFILPIYNDKINLTTDTSLCFGSTIQLELQGSTTQTWTPNTFLSSDVLPNPIANPDTTINYYVVGKTINGCDFSDSVLVEVFYTAPIPALDDTTMLCFGTKKTIFANGASFYDWTPKISIQTLNANEIEVSPLDDMTFYCDFINACGRTRDSIFIDVKFANLSVNKDTLICVGDSAKLVASGAEIYLWSPGNSLSSVSTSTVNASPKASTTYTIYGTNELGCKDTASVKVDLYPTHLVDAGIDQYAKIGDVLRLFAYSNTIGTYSWSPEYELSCTSCQNPFATPNENYSYTVTFKDTNGCETKDVVSITYNGILYVPNSFTPNSDQLNPIFKPFGAGIDQFRMDIFDRWGEVICTLTSFEESWDGTYLGKECQDGTYTWKITYSDFVGEIKTITGHVNLLR